MGRTWLAAVTLLSLFGSDTALAQAVSIGGRLGISNSAALFADEHSRNRIDDRRGLQVSGIVGHELNSVLSLQLELSYIQKGWAELETGGDRKLTYLELPLLLSINAPWTTSPHLLVGPSVSRELNCSVIGVPQVGSVSCSDPRLGWDREKLLFGLWFGLGLGRWLGTSKLDVQFLGNISLTDIDREELPPGYIRLATVTASATYKISLGGL
jgi:hypothetical protein